MSADSWYPPHERYWFDEATAAGQPLRMGDLVVGFDEDGDRWDAGLVVHPTCELAKPRAVAIQIVRVRRLATVADGGQQERIVLGWEL